ncbi:MAG TPA: zinc-ribbon domain-containing protein [Candidatus Acidoferrales bacterium]|nr:zinc-ribbon domain-containing protein [Candidatus Acidoferrales bacterium]
MPFCQKCGASVDTGAAFCPSCGTPQSVTSATAPPVAAAPPPGAAPVAVAAPQTGLSENVAGLLCYVFGWVTGLIFFLIDKRPFVRFHASQSITLFGGLHIVYFILGMILGIGMFGFGGLGGLGAIGFGWALFSLLDLVIFIAWILLMVKAYQGDRFRIPIAADLAEQIFGKS